MRALLSAMQIPEVAGFAVGVLFGVILGAAGVGWVARPLMAIMH